MAPVENIRQFAGVAARFPDHVASSVSGRKRRKHLRRTRLLAERVAGVLNCRAGAARVGAPFADNDALAVRHAPSILRGGVACRSIRRIDPARFARS
jgi:hypothetical protein